MKICTFLCTLLLPIPSHVTMLKLIAAALLLRLLPGHCQERRFALVLQVLEEHKFDLDRLTERLDQWNMPGFAPCMYMCGEEDRVDSIAFARECGYRLDTARMELPVLLILSNAPASPYLKNLIASHIGKARKCFSSIEYVASNLSTEEDAYPLGANVMFYKVFFKLYNSPDYAYFMYLELDVVPLRSCWLDVALSMTPPLSPRFWVKGSQLRNSMKTPWWLNYHINGNSIYNVHDEVFATFVQGLWANLPTNNSVPHVSYDLALSAGFYAIYKDAETELGFKFPRVPTRWSRQHLHLYQFSEYIANDYMTFISLEDSHKSFPCTVLLHGNTTHHINDV